MKMRSSGRLKKLAYLYEPLISAAAAFCIMLTVIGGFAFILTKIDVKDTAISVMSTAALGIGAYCGGYISGKRRRKNGLLMGVLCGVFIFLIVLILGALFSKAAQSFPLSAKLAVTLVCAAAGGVVGVNSRNV